MKLTYANVRRVANGYLIDTNWDVGRDERGNRKERPVDWEDPKSVVEDGPDTSARLGAELSRLFKLGDVI